MQLVAFLSLTLLVGFITYMVTRKKDHDSQTGYFLAGRSLTFPFIAGSLLLTNLSTEQLVGLNGDAYTHGLCVMVWEVVAVVGLICMALFFLPRFLKSGIATVPQYLDIRFDRQTQVITNLIFLVAYAGILLPIVLYTGAAGMIKILNVQELVGITDRTQAIWLLVWAMGIIGSIYALWGGLRTVAVSDLLNGFLLLAGGFVIVYFALDKLGGDAGFLGGFAELKARAPDQFNSVGSDETNVPFGTVFTGILLLNLFYWCTNQQIIQRTFGASTLAEGQKGVLLTGLLKLLGPLYLVLPGIIAFAMFQGQDVKASDVYGKLVHEVLPPALSGFFAAALLGAILSSFNSALNSTCTLFSLGVYKRMFRKDATDKQVVNSGKLFGILIAVVAMCVAPLLDGQDSIFNYLQTMNGMYFIPIFSVVLVGMLSKRVPPVAAKAALVMGFLAIVVGYFVPPFDKVVAQMHNFHFLGIVFFYLVALMLVIGEICPMEKEWVQEDVKAVDMTPWKYARTAAFGLLILVLAIYSIFADFAVLKKDGPYNMGRLVTCCQRYAKDKDGQFPETALDLYPAYVKHVKTFQDPGKADVDAAFYYVPGTTIQDGEDHVVLFEAVPKGDDVKGRNVAFADGSVQWLEEKAFQARLEKTAATLKKRNVELKKVPLAISDLNGRPVLGP